MSLESRILYAKQSAFGLWMLNQVLFYLIPFNRPHGIRVVSIKDNELKAFLPKRKSNLNHVNGSHACALAAAAEFSTGVLLLSKLSPEKYRIIMKKLEMEYFYQAKDDVTATCVINDAWLSNEVLIPLQTADRVIVAVESNLHDSSGNHLCTGRITWQIKEWSTVTTNSDGRFSARGKN